jgi:hypothetical protein
MHPSGDRTVLENLRPMSVRRGAELIKQESWVLHRPARKGGAEQPTAHERLAATTERGCD